MKIPRDITGQKLIKLLAPFGYEVTRQTGSHIRLTSNYSGKQHHITIPNHNPLSIGTLSDILSDIAQNLEKSKTDLIKELF